MITKKRILGSLLLVCLSSVVFAKSSGTNSQGPHGFYIGPSIGYGSTDWSFLTAKETSAAASSSPIAAKDKGLVYGAMLGYQFNRFFALEASFMQFPKSSITFRNFSFYWPDRENKTTISSNTQAYALYGKFIIPTWVKKFNVFAGAGVKYTRRRDELAKPGNRWGGIFVVGAMYHFTKHIAAELAIDYYTGYGKSEILPAYDYVPFLYQGHFAVLYYF